MGFLSKVAKTVKKGFKKVVGAVGKLASSTFGKVLLAAIVVFTLGTALVAGAGAFASTTGGFAAKFVAGAKAFAGALASPLKTAKGLFNGAGQAGAAAGQAAGAAAGTAGSVAQGAAGAVETAGAVGAAAPAATPIGVLTGEGVAGAAGASAGSAAAGAAGVVGPPSSLAGAASKGFISKAAGAVGKFAASPAGLQLIGNAAQGVAQGAQAERLIKEQRREQERIDAQFRDPAKIQQLQEVAARPVDLGRGFIERARNVANFMNNRPGSGPSVQPGDPNNAFGRYVVGY